jgi:hypothetical protein
MVLMAYCNEDILTLQAGQTEPAENWTLDANFHQATSSLTGGRRLMQRAD